MVDEAFNEIAAQDDDDQPLLKSALLEARARTNGLAALAAPVQDVPEEKPVPSTSASLTPTVPILSAGAMLLFFMLGCIAMLGRRPSS
jgi:hypothetical protein